MAKAKKLPSGMWRCQASVDGERRSFTSWTKREAELMALEWQTGIKEKRNPANITVEDAILAYIESKSAILAPTTKHQYERMLANHYNSIKHMKISKIKQTDVQREINELSVSHSPKTVKNIYVLLESACKFNYEITLPKRQKIKYNTPNIETIREIIASTAGTPIEVPVLLSL